MGQPKKSRDPEDYIGVSLLDQRIDDQLELTHYERRKKGKKINLEDLAPQQNIIA